MRADAPRLYRPTGPTVWAKQWLPGEEWLARGMRTWLDREYGISTRLGSPLAGEHPLVLETRPLEITVPAGHWVLVYGTQAVRNIWQLPDEDFSRTWAPV